MESNKNQSDQDFLVLSGLGRCHMIDGSSGLSLLSAKRKLTIHIRFHRKSIGNLRTETITSPFDLNYVEIQLIKSAIYMIYKI